MITITNKNLVNALPVDDIIAPLPGYWEPLPGDVEELKWK